MRTQDGGHHADAVTALADRRYDRAGDAYARAAWRTLADPRPEHNPFQADEKGWVGAGVAHLVMSAVCYRVAGRADRAENRGTEAEVVARDLQTALEQSVQQACLGELAADARLAGGLDGVADAYRTAADAYRDAGRSIDDPQRWSTTPLFQSAATPLQQVARSTADGEIAISWDDLHGPDPDNSGQFLATRARTKRQQFPARLDAVVGRGYLAAPRGTTEYNNATFECPNCGSNDVNWVGDDTLCMRCSTPMERQ